jgi:hypothetical protein
MDQNLIVYIQTNWREHTSPNGLIFFHNKVAKESSWKMPKEVKHARLKTVQEMILKNQVNKTLSAEVVRKSEIIAINILFSCINTKRKTTNSNDDLQTIRKKKNRKDEAREIFKNMLDELSVSWKDTWEQAA